MSHKLFVSLPIKNLDRTVAFFKALGFTFNPKFDSENGACMLIGKHAYAMLVVEDLFKTFTKKQICDTKTHVEGAYGISCESRAEVEAMWTKALACGAKDGGPPEDHAFMYSRSFEDLDGHHWEVVWMDPKEAVQ
ncbi:VOC family protein [Polyangium sp. 15x6]|uniref:VOC family protein n=1 Tax=Polyangium sp. 15x6 TaxID=3042687 RepID=UPI00249B12E3|nr:VOC family protein [Polyangium sp. 15x6]MDI3290483.1 glyoxalase/bleomycin resistance/extradiol dioxygenase family protein [Polyangium sp. 15x6]